MLEMFEPRSERGRLVGIGATRPTRGAADEAAECKLRRFLQVPLARRGAGR